MKFINIDKILKPISIDSVCGVPAENLLLYEKIIQYCESDNEGMNDQHGWSYQPRKSDWPKVKTLCEEMLETQSKDLQVLCWLAQALTELEGIAGIIEGVSLIQLFFSQFWDSLHPVEENDFSFRESHLHRLDCLFSRYLLTLSFDDENSINLFNWKKVQIFEQRVVTDPDVRERLTKEGYLSLDEWQKLISAKAGSHIEVIRNDCINLSQAIDTLVSYLCQQVGSHRQLFFETKKKLSEISDFFSRFYMRPPNIQQQNKSDSHTPDLAFPFDFQSPSGTDYSETPLSSTKYPEGEVSYSEHRAQALRQLETIIALFRENEPGSPIPYLLERAIRWSGMNTLEWMADIFSERNPHYVDGVSALLGPKYAHEIQMAEVIENQQREEYEMHHDETFTSGQSDSFDEF